MEISKARKIFELSRGDRRMLLTLWESGELSSCVSEDQGRQYCETCQGNDQLCSEYIEYLRGKGYEATEVELAELEPEESLPRFMEERTVTVEPSVEREITMTVESTKETSEIEEARD